MYNNQKRGVRWKFVKSVKGTLKRVRTPLFYVSISMISFTVDVVYTIAVRMENPVNMQLLSMSGDP